MKKVPLGYRVELGRWESPWDEATDSVVSASNRLHFALTQNSKCTNKIERWKEIQTENINRQHCRLNICSYIGWIDKYSVSTNRHYSILVQNSKGKTERRILICSAEEMEDKANEIKYSNCIIGYHSMQNYHEILWKRLQVFLTFIQLLPRSKGKTCTMMNFLPKIWQCSTFHRKREFSLAHFVNVHLEQLPLLWLINRARRVGGFNIRTGRVSQKIRLPGRVGTGSETILKAKSTYI